MTSNSTAVVSDDQKGFLSPQWHDRLSRLITRGKKATALALLEQTVERSLPLFRTDTWIAVTSVEVWSTMTTKSARSCPLE